MGDGSSRSIFKSLQKEWSLFLEVFHGEEKDNKNVADVQNSEMNNDQKFTVLEVRRATKELTEKRKRLNQQLESLNKEIESQSAKLESLKLVGAETEQTLDSIHKLNDFGQKISEALVKLDEKLRLVRSREIPVETSNIFDNL